ncbi:MAG TPA: hypothetical protein PKG49_03760, partial [Nitrosomonas mobilis]|nr:hypothetical protein [Nitrosomonas mobilis]
CRNKLVRQILLTFVANQVIFLNNKLLWVLVTERLEYLQLDSPGRPFYDFILEKKGRPPFYWI